MDRAALDFLVVGAQKAGTTALHMQMQRHPQIALPAVKEAPYFNRPLADRPLADFLSRHFADTRRRACWGKVSPQYMSNRETVGRIAGAMPDVRIVACLRDPVQRAVSHYNMLVRRGAETRPLDDALLQGASRATLTRARELPGLMRHEPDCYVAWGEYARILRYYLDAFPADRLLVVYFEDLVANPARVLSTVFAFLGVDSAFRPDNAGTRYFESAGGSRYPALKHVLRRIDGSPLRSVVSERLRDRLRMRFRMADERPPADAWRGATVDDLGESTRRRLVDIYRDDAARLPEGFPGRPGWRCLDEH